MQEKVYSDCKEYKISSKGYLGKSDNTLIPPEQFSGVIEQDVISLPDKTRAVAVFIMACFVFSEATVSRALLPSWFAYVVTGILFILSYYYWIRTEIVVYCDFKEGYGSKGISGEFSKQSHVLEFIDAMLRDYSANQNHTKQNSNIDKDIQTVANGIMKARKILLEKELQKASDELIKAQEILDEKKQILANKKQEMQNRIDTKKA